MLLVFVIYIYITSCHYNVCILEKIKKSEIELPLSPPRLQSSMRKLNNSEAAIDQILLYVGAV